MDAFGRTTDALESALRRFGGPPGDRPLVVAASGGPDSTALAIGLADPIFASDRRSVTLAHVVHGVHAGAPDAADRVAALARSRGFGFEARVLDLPPRAGEAVLREARYAALADVVESRGAEILMTAHHADDDLETILFRVMRGTGTRGLAGVPRARPFTSGCTLLRPFLDLRREDLLATVRAAGLDTIDDPTNRDLHRARNAIRHRLLPSWRGRLPGRFEARLLALARAARRRADRLERAAASWLAAHARLQPDGVLDMPSPPTSCAAEVLRLAHRRLAGLDPRRAWLERTVRLSRTGARVSGGGPVVALRTRDGLRLTHGSGDGRWHPLPPVAILNPARVPARPHGERPMPADARHRSDPACPF